MHVFNTMQSSEIQYHFFDLTIDSLPCLHSFIETNFPSLNHNNFIWSPASRVLPCLFRPLRDIVINIIRYLASLLHLDNNSIHLFDRPAYVQVYRIQWYIDFGRLTRARYGAEFTSSVIRSVRLNLIPLSFNLRQTIRFGRKMEELNATVDGETTLPKHLNLSVCDHKA